MLKVWLPLTGDLHNQGVSGVTATGHSVTSVAAGKIGSCYQFTTSAIELDDNIFDNNVTEFTIAAWMKFNNSNSACLFSDRTEINSTGITLFIMDSGGIFFDVGNRWQFTPSTAIPRNQWFHITFLYKKNVLRQVYLNGALVGSTTSAPAPTATSTSHSFIGASQNSSTALGGNYFNGQMNDVRIYDHALSAAEVKEIAKGLVLHYKLDNNGCGGRNLIRIGTGSFHNTDQLTTLTWTGWDSYNSLALTDMDWNNRYGQQITYSCYVENIEQTVGTGSGIMLHVRYADGTYQQFGGGKNGTQGQYLAQGESGWLRLVVTIPDASARSSPTTISYIQVSVRHNSSTGASTIKYKCPQVELGNKQTAWYWAPEDSGEDTTVVEDSSGYNHNGQMISNINTSTDTMRYNISALFDGVDDCIIVPYNTICPENIFTMNLWFKKDALGSKNYETLFGGPSGFEMDTRSGSSTALSLYMASTRGGNAATGLQLNTWYMVTMVRDGTNERYYINGELKKEIEAKTMPTGVYRIGAWASNTGQNYYGNISDFRIYCTPLLDTDIKQLYNVNMKVDKSQNIHTFEFNESAGKTQLKKTGVLKSALIADNLLFDNKAHIGKRTYENILLNDVDIVTTKSGHSKKGTLAAIPAAKMQSLAGKALRFIYDVKADGARSSTENGQTAYNYTRYGIHASFPYTNASGATGTSYPFAGELNYSGGAKHAIQTWTVPTGYQSYGALSFSIQNFDKPASTNNETWFIQNVRLEVIDNNTNNGYVTGTQIIEK